MLAFFIKSKKQFLIKNDMIKLYNKKRCLMKKIKTILFATLIMLSPTLVLASEGVTVGDEEVQEMSSKYIELTDARLNLELTSEQKKEMTDIMVNYVYEFKEASDTEEAKELEESFTDDIRDALNEKQWGIVSTEIKKKEKENVEKIK
jgi:hypothetical protein